jgi:uncharacterized protein YegP (UPF0339 family)
VSKWIRSLTLAGVFAVAAGGVVGVSGPAAIAQQSKAADKKAADPKKPEEPKKTDDKKSSSAKGSVIIKPDAKGRFRISVKDDGGKTLLMSAGNGFETEKEAKDAVEEIKGILAAAKVTVEKGDAKEKDK